jgi:hypothetical protein
MGTEQPYIQMWLIATLRADPFIQASYVAGKVYEQPGDVAILPAILVEATPDQSDSVTQRGNIERAEVVFSIDAVTEGDDLAPLIPVMDRVNILLNRVFNEVWVSPDLGDGYTGELTIFKVTRMAQLPGRTESGDQIFRSLGGEWRFRVQLLLTGDVTA